MDFATQAAINPCESLLADTLHSSSTSEGHSDSSFTLGFKVYSFMTTLGSCIGYSIACIDWTNVASMFIYDRGSIGTHTLLKHEQATFILVTILFALTAVITMVSARETVPNQFNSFEKKIEVAINATDDRENKALLCQDNSTKTFDFKLNVIKTKFSSEQKDPNETLMKSSFPSLFYKFLHQLSNFFKFLLLPWIFSTKFITQIVLMGIFKAASHVVILSIKVRKMILM